MDEVKIPKLCGDTECTGCLACVNTCNHRALTIVSNEEGFYRPSLNEDKCVGCLLCEKICPVVSAPARNKIEEQKVYAVWNKNQKIRAKSTSGGAFSALAEVVLNKNGFVFGAAYANDLKVEHIGIDKVQELNKLRLSKYVQSYIGNTLNEIRNLLQSGKYVLFVGTPCQVAGLKNFLRKDYDNLITVDFFCHGVPSSTMFRLYLDWLESKYGKIKNIVFRDKRKGWYDSLRLIETIHGKKKIIRGKKDAYWVAFNNLDSSLQESCYKCKMNGISRVSDITIADFWRIGNRIPFGHIDEIEKGVSMLSANNNKALTMVEEVKPYLYIEERTIEEAISGNPAAISSSKRPKDRDTIYKDLKIMDFESFRKRYLIPPFRQLLVKLFRERMPYEIIKYVRLRNQK